MPDLEKVIKGLGESAASFRESFNAMDGTLACEIFRSWAEAMEQAIALLKEQQETIWALEIDLDDTLDVMCEYAEKLKAREPIEARLHLCESCAKEYPECDATVYGIKFGSGVGNDNIIGCTVYVNRWTTSRPTDEQRRAVKWDE